MMSNQAEELLHQLKSLSGPFPPWNLEHLPDQPGKLFLEWLKLAIENNVKEPHAMTLSTVDQQGYPDARVLILKNIIEDTFYFASSSNSRKGQQLHDNPKVALTLYWPALGRQIRIRGIAQDQGDEAGASDFRKRKFGARVVAMTERQSQQLIEEEELNRSIEVQKKRLREDPDFAAPHWRLYAVHAEEVEFWQGDTDRKHIRVQYTRQDEQWHKNRLWP
ncbi:pyridoxal 5'-phosphate synthase [Paenibacillus sp. RRE4]|uniref:pyridoxine/pyridoxamine 5'-phosphate oxidase n=1 Tax=Paenibacillus sp. RRE4 TaxID=2962587 RepID=UPI00288245D7|nr:pyridoxal 5'-phosphate synthase [Paenibacillus sp. RRE4]MDT0121690.1 pyridoxal 5'-phosphate synthase [Paenibacillus sp. RRE4]